MKADDQKRLLKLISELLAKKDVRLEHRLREDLGADSLDTVELFLAIEDAFSVEIPDETAEQLATVQDVVSFIDQYERNR
jgi:acyl carrier protein